MKVILVVVVALALASGAWVYAYVKGGEVRQLEQRVNHLEQQAAEREATPVEAEFPDCTPVPGGVQSCAEVRQIGVATLPRWMRPGFYKSYNCATEKEIRQLEMQALDRRMRSEMDRMRSKLEAQRNPILPNPTVP